MPAKDSGEKLTSRCKTFSVPDIEKATISSRTEITPITIRRLYFVSCALIERLFTTIALRRAKPETSEHSIANTANFVCLKDVRSTFLEWGRDGSTPRDAGGAHPAILRPTPV